MLNTVAFDANDWGMASTLQALLNTTDTQDDYYINSKFAKHLSFLGSTIESTVDVQVWVERCH